MSIPDALKMEHLSEGLALDELQEEIERDVPAKSDKPPDDKPDPRDEEKYVFYVNHTDPRGKKFDGEFTNQILDIGARQKVGVLQAKLAGSVPLEALDSDTVVLNRMIAHMTYSLVGRPRWAEDFQRMFDIGLVAAIWMKVVDHEDHFFRTSPVEETGSQDGEG